MLVCILLPNARPHPNVYVVTNHNLVAHWREWAALLAVKPGVIPLGKYVAENLDTKKRDACCESPIKSSWRQR